MPENTIPEENLEPIKVDKHTAEDVPNEVEDRLNRLEKYIATIAEPAIQRKDPSRSRWERAADGFESHPFSRLAIALGAVLAIFSLIGVAATALGVWFQYQSSTEERITRAWQLLSSSATGNSGKGQALEFLHSQGERLVGINLGGTSRVNGTYISELELNGAVLDRPNLNFGELVEVDFNKVNIQRAKSNHVIISGKLANTDFLWSELEGAIIKPYSGSSIEFYENLLDGLKLYPDSFNYRQSSNGLSEKIPDNELAAAYPKLTFYNSSLRCASLPYYPITSFKFEDVDISGVFFDFDDFRKSASNEAAWKNMKGAWYYSDNPPIGVPPEQMKEHLFSRDRQTVLDICNKHEPRAFRDDPLGELSGPNGIEMTCVSLARKPDKCKPYDPYSPYARIQSLYNDPEKYGLEQ